MPRVAVVTGGTRGIGGMVSKQLAEKGYTVAAVYGGNDEAARKFNADTGIPVFKIDVSDFDACKNGIAEIEAQLGPVEILVNNAGGGQERTNVGEDDPQQWVHVVEVNLIGTYYVSRAALPLLKQNGGTIINVSSGMAHQSRSGNSSYNASKAAVWMFTRCLASEVWPDRITVNELIPGPVYTELTQSLWSPDQPHPTIASEWIKRPHDVAPLALFLASQSGQGPTAQSFSLARRAL